MSDAVFFLLIVVGMVSFCTLIVKRGRRTESQSGLLQLIEMLLMRPVAFMKEDVYGVVVLAAFGLIAAFPNTDPATTMFKGGANSDEDIALIAFAALCIATFVFSPRLWWATGIPQRVLSEAKGKDQAERKGEEKPTSQ